jgi:predicted nuclease with TOPRIM domain
MAEVVCGDCGSRADDVVCWSCYDGKVREIKNLEDDLATKEKEISRLESEVSRLEDKVSELEQGKE